MTTVEQPQHELAESAATRVAGKVAYIMSRFPKLTETFVLYEIIAVEQAGMDVEIMPLQREKTKVMHREAERLVERARFTPFLLSWSLILAHFHFLGRKPGIYLGTIGTLIRANWGSRRYLTGALAFFP